MYAPQGAAQLGQVTELLPKAVQWVKDNLQKFYALPLRIGNAQRRATELEKIAASKGMEDAIRQLRGAQVELMKQSAEQTRWSDRVKDLLQKLGSVGVQLGVIPVAIVAIAVLVAAGIAAIFANVAKQERLIDAVAKGVLTPEEAAKFGRAPLVGLNIGGAMPWLLGAGALYFFGPRLLAGLRRARSNPPRRRRRRRRR